MIGWNNSVGCGNIDTNNLPVAFLEGSRGVGGNGNTPAWHRWRYGYNSDYFSYTEGDDNNYSYYTCKQAFSGTVKGWGLGGRNTNGTSTTHTIYVKVKRGSTTSNIISYSDGAAVRTTTYNFQIGDQIWVSDAVSTLGSTFWCSAGMTVCIAS